MSDTSDDLNAPSIKELKDPAFLTYVKLKFPKGPLEPEKEDLDQSAPAHTPAEEADQYRLAQARRLMRLYREWKVSLN